MASFPFLGGCHRVRLVSPPQFRRRRYPTVGRTPRTLRRRPALGRCVLRHRRRVTVQLLPVEVSPHTTTHVYPEGGAHSRRTTTHARDLNRTGAAVRPRNRSFPVRLIIAEIGSVRVHGLGEDSVDSLPG